MTSAYIWPILAASVAAFGIGALWYSPLMFGKQWMALIKMSDSDMAAAREKGVAAFYAIQFVITVVTFIVIAFLIELTGANTPGHGIFIAVLAWIGFPVVESIGQIMWQKKPWKLAAISLLGTLVCWVVGGAIIGAWR